ncbi:hypothetical protein HDU67_004101 [Dinochytrium kinnereticum]|nr:hypothetical protein HDU67_004101 [Dinochytrium kinnereticum]
MVNRNVRLALLAAAIITLLWFFFSENEERAILNEEELFFDYEAANQDMEQKVPVEGNEAPKAMKPAFKHAGKTDPLHHIDLSFGSGLPDPDAANYIHSRENILSQDLATNLSTAVKKSRHFKAYGFEFCRSLNNASFDSLAYIHDWGCTIAERNPTMAEFVHLLDGWADLMTDRILTKYPWLHTGVGGFAIVALDTIESLGASVDLERLICYAISEGANSFVNITDSRLTKHVDPINYLSPIIPAVKPRKSRIPGPRRKYQIAYLLMVHGEPKMLENVIELIDQLDDGSAIILIHVDQKWKALYNQITLYLEQREATINAKLRPDSPPEPCNVFMAKNRFDGLWGHSSLVRMQLSGFWELLDLADWDYVINLSGEDFPLRRSREIYRVLQMEKHQGFNWIEHWDDNAESAARISRPHVPTMERRMYRMMNIWEAGLLSPPFTWWRTPKCHQWMILTKEFVQYLRESEEAATALAYIELSWIPDETYFCYVLVNTPRFAGKTINDKKRFLTFPSYESYHPMVLDIGSRGLIGTDEPGREPRYFFARKVDIKFPKGRELMEWILFEHIRKHLTPGGYGELGGEKWVDLEKVMDMDSSVQAIYSSLREDP